MIRIEAIEELAAHYTQTREEFERHAAFFRKHVWLAQRPELWSGLEAESDCRPASLVLDVGGTSFGGNEEAQRKRDASRQERDRQPDQ